MKSTREQGYIMLLFVILLSAVGSAIAFALILLSLANSRTNFTLQQSKQAKYNAETCAEIALMNLVESQSFQGGETFGLSQGSCELLQIDLNAGVYTIKAIGRVGNLVVRIKLEAQRATSSPFNMTINSWRQVADF